MKIFPSIASTISSASNAAAAAAEMADPLLVAKLCGILEAVGDRVELHKNIGKQRNNWNSLLLTSTNMMILSATMMIGTIAATGSNQGTFSALQLSAGLLYLAATGMLLVVNKIQPSQLAEEQRNAARLFCQLYNQIHMTLSFKTPTASDVNEAMQRILALDEAYPLPLLGKMLDKFPEAFSPAVWWPRICLKQNDGHGCRGETGGNGWDRSLEDEMRNITCMIKREDLTEYLRLGNKALRLNKALSISGPLLTTFATIGAAMTRCGHGSSPAVVIGMVSGVLACIVNTLEHGGQVGMVVEMYRNTAGFFKLATDKIESTLAEIEVGERENGQVFALKMALQLGRSPPELKKFRSLSCIYKRQGTETFASKLL